MTQKELDKEQANADFITYGTPTPGVDHSNHWKPLPYPTPAILKLVKLPKIKAFNIERKE